MKYTFSVNVCFLLVCVGRTINGISSCTVQCTCTIIAVFTLSQAIRLIRVIMKKLTPECYFMLLDMHGHSKVVMQTADTDVVVLVISQMHNLQLLELWLEFGVGKHYRVIPVHSISVRIGPEKACTLPFSCINWMRYNFFFCW